MATPRRAGSKRPARRAPAARAAAQPAAGLSPIPPRIYAQVSPLSVGGVSLFDAQDQIHSETIVNFVSDGEIIVRAMNRLHDAGFEILHANDITINIAGSAEAYERAFNTRIVAEERPVIKPGIGQTTATFLDTPDPPLSGLISTAGTPFEDVIEGVALEEPRYYMAPSMFAPLKAYWHLRLPGDVSLADNADRAHRSGVTGSGVKIAMCDSGWYRHPYFVGRGYRAAPVVLGPGAANPLADEVGHGTGESANIFAVAPDIELLPVKMSFVNSVGAFNVAVGLGPQIITCSWGSSVPYGPLSAADQALAAAIAAAVAGGITVVFSAGNGHAGFPGQHPDVISAGGTFMRQDETLEASNYASGFMSNVYPGRRVPDLCGLVGMRPKAIYLMLPLEPGDQIDVGNAGGAYPNGDETANNDGWAGFSGTSAAAPQLAGAAALVKQACPGLNPAAIKDVLMTTARDVTQGTCNAVPPLHTGLPATVGPDTATGNGLVDAQRAVLVARLRCLGPIVAPRPFPPPIPPIPPVIAPRPVVGPQPPGPRPVVGPLPPRPRPVVGPQPPRPVVGPQPPGPRPVVGPRPPRPRPPGPRPVVGPGPRQASDAEALGSGVQPESSLLSAEDVQALEEMITEGRVNLDI